MSLIPQTAFAADPIEVCTMKYNKKARKWVKVKGTQAYFYKVKL